MKFRYIALILLPIVTIIAWGRWHRAKLLKPLLLPCTGDVTFYDSSHQRHFDASSRAANAVGGWIAEHQAGWKFSSTPFGRNHTQIISNTYGIDLNGNLLLLEYKKYQGDDDDDDIHIERLLTLDEQKEWKEINERILAYNSVLESLTETQQ